MGTPPHRSHRTEKGSHRCGPEARHPHASPVASQPRLLSPSETESPDRYRVETDQQKKETQQHPVGSTSIELTSKGSGGEHQPTARPLPKSEAAQLSRISPGTSSAYRRNREGPTRLPPFRRLDTAYS